MYRILSPHDGHYGDWSDFAYASCKGTFFNGVEIEIYPKGASDERGATNLRMFCGDGLKMEGKNPGAKR